MVDQQNKAANPQSEKKVRRGKGAVKAALITVAGELLAEIGPKAMSVRDVAVRAGVNHGQVHHYFNGKEGLIKAAIRALAKEHLEHVKERADGGKVPPPLTLRDDPLYVRAVVRLVMDGELEMATMEIQDGVSVPRMVFNSAQETQGPDDSIVDLKSVLAASMAIELGWSVLEPYIFNLVDVQPGEEKSIRDRIRYLVRHLPGLLNIMIPGFDQGVEKRPE